MQAFELDTPALTIDLDVVERNIATTQAYYTDRSLRFRPHIKTHKLPILAHKQIAAGAAGIAVQKIGEAEVMAAAGIDDILICYNILGRPKLERLTRIARQAKISVIADSEVTVDGLADAAGADGAVIGVLVEMDTGGGRVGVQTPEEAVRLAERIGRGKGLKFLGLMTFPTTEKTQAIFEETMAKLESAGLPAEIRSGGGSGRRFQVHEAPAINEHRAGTYVYGDTTMIDGGACTLDECAMKVLVTVVSRPTPERAIVDGGSKTFSNDHPSESGYGYFPDLPDARLYMQSEEHGHVNVAACPRKPGVGEKLWVIPRHACATTNLHDEVVATRQGRIEAIWPILARGKLR